MRHLLVLCAALYPSDSWAREEPATTLDPVVVTGSRVERSAFDLPFAVTSVTAAEFSAAGAQINLSEALARVPGLLVNNRGNYAQDLQINSRGFGARAGFGVRGLRLYSDGIPATAPDGQGQVSHFDLMSAERIEVLRGPFSALYGNSSGGVISLISQEPETSRMWAGGSASGFVSGAGGHQFRGGAQARFGEHANARINYSDFSTGGFRPHSSADRRLAYARAGLSGARDKFIVTASHLDLPAQDPLGLNRAQFDADPRQTTMQAEQFNTRKNTAQTQTGLSWHRQLGPDVFREFAVAAYGGRRAVTQWLAIPVAAQQASTRHPGGVIDFDRRFGGVDSRTHLRIGAVDLIGGLAYEQQDEDRRGFENFIGTQLGVTGALRRDEANRVSSFDQYLQAEWEFIPAWTGTLGLRHGEIRFQSDDRFLSNGDDSDRRSFSYTNPVAGISYRAAPDLNLYASAGRGFESPTLNELAYRPDGSAGFNTVLDAQVSRQIELGGKLRLGASRLELALFRAGTDDELVVQTNSGGRSAFGNAGRTRREGAELSLYSTLAAQWEARFAATWLEAKYRDDFLTCASVPCSAPTLVIPAGNRIPATARTSAYAELAWTPRLSLTVGLEGRAVSSLAVNDTNSDFAAGYGLLALRGEHTLELDSWRLRSLLRLDNVLNRTYAGSVIVNESNGRYFEPGAPRAAFLGLTLERQL